MLRVSNPKPGILACGIQSPAWDSPNSCSRTAKWARDRPAGPVPFCCAHTGIWRILGRGMNPWLAITCQDAQPGIRNALARHHRTTFVLFKIKENLHQINRLVVSAIQVIIIITVHHTASHYKTLQYTESSSHYNSLQHVATHCKTLQHIATRCIIISQNHMQNIATHCNSLQHTATHRNILQQTVSSSSLLRNPPSDLIQKTRLILH